MVEGLQLHPVAEPYAEGVLEVGGGQRIWWSARGNPAGKPGHSGGDPMSAPILAATARSPPPNSVAPPA